jgi:hypothetical protein
VKDLGLRSFVNAQDDKRSQDDSKAQEAIISTGEVIN